MSTVDQNRITDHSARTRFPHTVSVYRSFVTVDDLWFLLFFLLGFQMKIVFLEIIDIFLDDQCVSLIFILYLVINLFSVTCIRNVVQSVLMETIWIIDYFRLVGFGFQHIIFSECSTQCFPNYKCISSIHTILRTYLFFDVFWYIFCLLLLWLNINHTELLFQPTTPLSLTYSSSFCDP